MYRFQKVKNINWRVKIYKSVFGNKTQGLGIINRRVGYINWEVLIYKFISSVVL